MTAATQNSSSISETLEERKVHLTVLIMIVDTNVGKSTAIQNLTLNVINAEMRHPAQPRKIRWT